MTRSSVRCVLLLLVLSACKGGAGAPLKELQRVKSGTLDIVLLAEGDSLKPGKGTFAIEFRDGSGNLVDVGDVTVTATMPMAGMAPMFGESAVTPTPTKGRYEVTSDLGMAGTWRLNIAWNGAGGKGSASLSAAAT